MSTPGAIERSMEGAPAASSVRPELATALNVEPGSELLTGLLEVMAGPGELSTREQLELVAAWDRTVGFCQAARLTAVQHLDQALHPDVADLTSVPLRKTANELAPVLRIAPRAASALVGHARRTRNLPAAVDGLAEGRLTAAQLDVLDQVTRDLPERLRGKVEAEAIRFGPTTTRQQLHGHLASKAAELDPDHASNAVERGTCERDVRLRPSPLPGCHRLVADLPSMSAYAVWHALNGAAQRAKTAAGRAEGGVDDERGIAALRADALAALVTGQPDEENPELVPAAEILTQLAQVQVVVAADTLTGESDLPAHLPGAGPVDPRTVRHLATKVPWRRLVADPDSGLLMHRDTNLMQAGGDEGSDPRLDRLTEDPVVANALDYGTTRYRPPKHLRDHVHTRDGTCIGPACHHPARGTQIDHTTNFNEPDARGRQGATAHYNLGSPCIRWHNSKTHLGWRLEQPAPGHFVWTSPLGRVYTRVARSLVPGWRDRRERPPPYMT
ncbi:MAG TPA: DUF222 domain-containing protein [Actinomycetales bacterium]|nr:DUF222 domain-containing protein [Actinomycetales bacterium]